MTRIDRYHAPHVVTQDEQDRWLSPGVVEVADGGITFVGAPAELAGTPPDAEVTEHHLDGLLLPGFVNAHAHSPMVLLRGAGEGLPVDRWLTEVMWPREARLTREDVGWGMTLGAAQLLRGGVTTSVEMYFETGAVADAARAAGLRCVVTPPVLIAADLSELGTWEQQLERAVAYAHAFAEDPLVEVGLGPHSAYAVPEAPLREIARLAVEEGLLVHIHVAEARHEGDGILEQHGVSVPRYLADLGMLEARMLAAHSVWLGDDDITLFAAEQVGVAHCPMSNGKHASGIARVTDLRAAGVPVAIATDGPASHDRLDLFEEMRTAIRLARLRAGDASAFGPRDALRMVTREAADAIGRADLGAIEVGRRADLLHVRTDGPAFTPVVETPSDLLTHLVWSGSPELVDRVWVEGREVVRDGAVQMVDVEAAVAEVTTRARRLAVDP